jgi:hypothetical protein
MKDQMKKKLIAVQVDGTAAQIPSENRDFVFTTEIDIDLLVDVLMESDADIRRRRRYQRQSFTAQFGQGVINELGILPLYFSEVIQFQTIISSGKMTCCAYKAVKRAGKSEMAAAAG